MMIVPNITPQYNKFNTDRRVGFGIKFPRIIKVRGSQDAHSVGKTGQGGFFNPNGVEILTPRDAAKLPQGHPLRSKAATQHMKNQSGALSRGDTKDSIPVYG